MLQGALEPKTENAATKAAFPVVIWNDLRALRISPVIIFRRLSVSRLRCRLGDPVERKGDYSQETVKRDTSQHRRGFDPDRRIKELSDKFLAGFRRRDQIFFNCLCRHFSAPTKWHDYVSQLITAPIMTQVCGEGCVKSYRLLKLILKKLRSIPSCIHLTIWDLKPTDIYNDFWNSRWESSGRSAVSGRNLTFTSIRACLVLTVTFLGIFPPKLNESVCIHQLPKAPYHRGRRALPC